MRELRRPYTPEDAVAVTALNEYTYEGSREALINALDAIGGIDFIKPVRCRVR